MLPLVSHFWDIEEWEDHGIKHISDVNPNTIVIYLGRPGSRFVVPSLVRNITPVFIAENLVDDYIKVMHISLLPRTPQLRLHDMPSYGFSDGSYIKAGSMSIFGYGCVVYEDMNLNSGTALIASSGSTSLRCGSPSSALAELLATIQLLQSYQLLRSSQPGRKKTKETFIIATDSLYVTRLINTHNSSNTKSPELVKQISVLEEIIYNDQNLTAYIAVWIGGHVYDSKIITDYLKLSKENRLEFLTSCNDIDKLFSDKKKREKYIRSDCANQDTVLKTMVFANIMCDLMASGKMTVMQAMAEIPKTCD